MSAADFKKVPIIVLEDITIKLLGNNNIQEAIFKESGVCPQNFAGKIHNLKFDNQKNEVHSRKVQDVSMWIFEEEPYFSDSDEEKTYSKLFETYMLENASDKALTNRTEKVDTEVQCDLLFNNGDIKNFVKICASVDIESVKEDYKELVHLCKKLEHKHVYETPPISRAPSNNSFSCEVAQQIALAPNIETDSNTPVDFLPSRRSNVYMKEQSFSESFSLGKADLHISKIIDGLDIDDSINRKENIDVRRSTRSRRQTKLSRFSGIFVKADKNNRQKNKNRSKNLPKDSATLKNAKSKTKPRKQNIKNMILDFQKNLKKKKKKINTVSNSIPRISAKYTNRVHDIDIKIPLPKTQVRSLARNWMKPDKNLFSGYEVYATRLDRRNTSLPTMAKMRRLYSSDEWMHSKEFATLELT